MQEIPLNNLIALVVTVAAIAFCWAVTIVVMVIAGERQEKIDMEETQ